MSKLRCFLLLIVTIAFSHEVFAQTDTTSSKVKQEEWVRGIRFGCDLSRFALPYVQKGRRAVEFSIDTEWKPKLFITGEAGFENVGYRNEYLNYRSNGFYVRAGYDKNVMKHDTKQYHDMFFIGFRYGLSVMQQEVISFSIEDGYWGNIGGSYDTKTLQNHWFEFVFGAKAEISKSIYLGFSARIRYRVLTTKDINYAYSYPGFGNGENRLTAGFNYSIYYQIPLMKVKN